LKEKSSNFRASVIRPEIAPGPELGVELRTLSTTALVPEFATTSKSIIPNVPDLESFFSKLEKRIKNLDRKRDYSEYIDKQVIDWLVL